MMGSAAKMSGVATRHPIPAEYQIHDARFLALIVPGAELRHLHEGSLWAEGPVYLPDADVLLWSDVRRNRSLRLDVATGAVVVHQPANFNNGHTRDREGRVVACEHGTRSVVRFEHDGTRTVLADRFDGKLLNSPNDVVVASDGSIWFTDPTYGIDNYEEGHPAESEIGASFVYRIDPLSGSVTAVVTDMVRPNGLALSIDERSLYVADTGASHVPDGPRHIRRYDVDVAAGRVTGGGEVFAICPVGAFDGFRLDVDGRLWSSGRLGVHCYDPDGTLLGTIRLRETCSNVEFGGRDRRTLYMTATTSLYALDVGVAGAR